MLTSSAQPRDPASGRYKSSRAAAPSSRTKEISGYWRRGTSEGSLAYVHVKTYDRTANPKPPTKTPAVSRMAPKVQPNCTLPHPAAEASRGQHGHQLVDRDLHYYSVTPSSRPAIGEVDTSPAPDPVQREAMPPDTTPRSRMISRGENKIASRIRSAGY